MNLYQAIAAQAKTSCQLVVRAIYISWKPSFSESKLKMLQFLQRHVHTDKNENKEHAAENRKPTFVQEPFFKLEK